MATRTIAEAARCMKTEESRMLILDASRMVAKFLKKRPHMEVMDRELSGYFESLEMEMTSLEEPIIESIPGWPFRYSHRYR